MYVNKYTHDIKDEQVDLQKIMFQSEDRQNYLSSNLSEFLVHKAFLSNPNLVLIPLLFYEFYN